jgi:hypothetical protein
LTVSVLSAGVVVAADPESEMSFFVTSAGMGDGANLGGIDGVRPLHNPG